MVTTPAKRNPVKRRFERDLERGLDRMSASKRERVAARTVFRHQVALSPPVRYSVAMRNALKVAVDVRNVDARTSHDTSTESA